MGDVIGQFAQCSAFRRCFRSHMTAACCLLEIARVSVDTLRQTILQDAAHFALMTGRARSQCIHEMKTNRVQSIGAPFAPRIEHCPRRNIAMAHEAPQLSWRAWESARSPRG